MFAGLLKCSDCGANLNYKYTHKNPENNYFSCRNKRQNNGLCKTTHHIRVDVITQIVQNKIFELIEFYNYFEDEFVKLVASQNYKQIQLREQKYQYKMMSLKQREKEIDMLFENLYEDKTFKRINSIRFKKLAEKYECENMELQQKINEIETDAKIEKMHENNAERFIGVLVKYRYSDLKTMPQDLTSTILHEFIDKIMVHHREDGEIGKYVEQKTEIFFKYIGEIDLPVLSPKERQSYLKVFSRETQDTSKNEKTLPVRMVM